MKGLTWLAADHALTESLRALNDGGRSLLLFVQQSYPIGVGPPHSDLMSPYLSPQALFYTPSFSIRTPTHDLGGTLLNP